MEIVHRDDTIRYVLDRNTRYIWASKDFDHSSRIDLPGSNPELPIWVNIIEVDDIKIKVKLYYPSGQVFEGWYLRAIDNIKIYNYNKLFDGRFNQ